MNILQTRDGMIINKMNRQTFFKYFGFMVILEKALVQYILVIFKNPNRNKVYKTKQNNKISKAKPD